MSDEIRIPGKKKHVRKPDAEADPEFQIAPMIDILLVLLVFFMSITSTEVLQQNQAVELPIAKDAKDSVKAPGQVIINVLVNPISKVPAIEVDQQYPSMGDLANELAAKSAKNPQMRVLIRADREVRYEFMRTLLETVGKAGIGTVTFATVDKEGKK